MDRDKIKCARLVANPGCYATAVQLGLIPLLRSRQVCCEDIIIDAKSGEWYEYMLLYLCSLLLQSVVNGVVKIKSSYSTCSVD